MIAAAAVLGYIVVGIITARYVCYRAVRWQINAYGAKQASRDLESFDAEVWLPTTALSVLWPITLLVFLLVVPGKTVYRFVTSAAYEEIERNK